MHWRYGLVDKDFRYDVRRRRRNEVNPTRLKRFPTTRRGLTVCADASLHRHPAGEDFVLSESDGAVPGQGHSRVMAV
jgi:hypothetical protein